MNFSERQVRHVYVANSVLAANTTPAAVGAISPCGITGKSLYFKHFGAGGLTCSDKIDVSKIVKAELTKYADICTKLATQTVAVNTAIVGQLYAVKVSFRNYIGMGDEDTTARVGVYRAKSTDVDKAGVARVMTLTVGAATNAGVITISVGGTNHTVTTTAGESASLVASAIAGLSIPGWTLSASGATVTFTKATVGVDTTVFTFTDTGTTGVTGVFAQSVAGVDEVVAVNNIAAGLATALQLAVKDENLINVTVSGNVITLAEVEQPWILGKMPVAIIHFSVGIDPITENGANSYEWATIAKGDSIATNDGVKKLADLEYFAHGERGDVYRGMGYPRNIETTYLTNLSSTYDVITIHYFYSGEGLENFRSDKDIQIFVPAGNTTLAAAINTLTGAASGSDANIAY